MMAVAAVAGNPVGLKPWEEARRYENDELLFAIERKLFLPRSEALKLFTDLKLYLWLSARIIRDHESGLTTLKQIKVDDDLHLLDEAWHLFLQFTKDYSEFCERYLGFFLHHVPVTEKAREARRERFNRDPEGLISEEKAEFKEMLSWIYDHAGKETVERWFLKKSYSNQKSLDGPT